jgi:hypothetical protein
MRLWLLGFMVFLSWIMSSCVAQPKVYDQDQRQDPAIESDLI